LHFLEDYPMRVLHTCALFAALATVSYPALAQSTSTSATDPATASVDYQSLKEGLANQNKSLSGEVLSERAIVKRNQDLLKEAMKLDVANKKLLAEKQKLNEQNAALEKQRAALAASQADTTNTASAK
jgi:hypothetical protein